MCRVTEPQTTALDTSLPAAALFSDKRVLERALREFDGGEELRGRRIIPTAEPAPDDTIDWLAGRTA